MKRIALSVVAWVMLANVSAAQPAANPPPDPAAMTRRQLREEVTRLRGIVQNRAVQPNRPAGCNDAEHRQFDFWLGEWDVSPTGSNGVIIAESSITAADQGCVILEEWRPFGGAHGHSINIFDATEHRWRQTWADATGRRTEYAGVLDANGVLRFDNLSPPENETPPGRRHMNYQRIDADTVRQWGELFDERGGAWTIEWDLTYRRRAGGR